MVAQKITDFFAVVLASGAIIEVWHKGSIFSEARAYVQAWHDGAKYGTTRYRLGELLLCPFCQSYHVPLYLYLLLLLCDSLSGSVGTGFRLVLAALAATRLGNIINGLLPPGTRYDADE
jgi:hypothetical protein